MMMTGINTSKKMASKEFFAKKSSSTTTKTAKNSAAAAAASSSLPSYSSSCSTNRPTTSSSNFVPHKSSTQSALKINSKETKFSLAKNSNNNNNNNGIGVADTNNEDDADHHFECFELIKFKSLAPKPEDDDGDGQPSRRRRSSSSHSGVNNVAPSIDQQSSINPIKHNNRSDNRKQNRFQNESMSRYGSGSSSKIKYLDTKTTLPSPVPEIVSTNRTSDSTSVFGVNFDDSSLLVSQPCSNTVDLISNKCWDSGKVGVVPESNCGKQDENSEPIMKPITPSRRKKINPSNNNNNNNNSSLFNCSKNSNRTTDLCSTTTTTTTVQHLKSNSDTNGSKTTAAAVTMANNNNNNNNKCVGRCNKKPLKNHSTPVMMNNNSNKDDYSCCCSNSVGTNKIKKDNPEPLVQVLATLKDQNKNLIKEIEDLRIKLEDAEGDLKLVQCQMRQMSKQIAGTSPKKSSTTAATESKLNRNKLLDENLINELDFLKEKVIILERDIQTLLVEKEDSILERNKLQIKNEQLNEHLISMIKFLPNLNQHNNLESNGMNPYKNPGPGTRSSTPIVGAASVTHHPQMSNDIDALYLENRYLKEKIKNDDEERSLLLDRLATYKDLADYGHHHQPAPPPPAQHLRHPTSGFGLGKELINEKSHHHVHGSRHHHSYSTSSTRTNQPSTCDTINDSIIQPFDSGSNTNDVDFVGAGTVTLATVVDNPLPTKFQLSDGHIVDVRDIENMVSLNTIHSMEVNRSNQLYLWELLRALFQGLQNKNRQPDQLLGKRLDEFEIRFGAKSSPSSIDMAAMKPLSTNPRPKTSGPILSRYHCDQNIETISSGSPKYELHDQSPFHHYPHHLGMANFPDESVSIVSMDDHHLQGGDTLPTTTTATITPKETSDDDDGVEEFDSISTPSTTRRSMSIERQLQALQNEALKDDDDDDDTTPHQSYVDLSNVPIMATAPPTSVTIQPKSDPKTGYDDDDGYKCDFDVVALDTSSMHHLMANPSNSGKKSSASNTTTTINKLYN